MFAPPQMGNFKEAVVYQKKVYDAQRTYSGATDASTADAEKWLTTLLKLAVEAQKCACLGGFFLVHAVCFCVHRFFCSYVKTNLVSNLIFPPGIRHQR